MTRRASRPACGRPTTFNHQLLRSSNCDRVPRMTGSEQMGTMTSAALPTWRPEKPGAATPIMAKGWPTSKIERPSTSRCPPNSFRQNTCPSHAQAAPPDQGDLKYLVRVAYREEFQHYRIDQAEDRGICADAKRQRKNSHCCEPRAGSQVAKCIAEVLAKRVEHG